MRRLLLFILICVASGINVQAQQDQFTIKVDTQLVIETLTVKDRDGKTIEGLTDRDFTVTEDGIRQTISVFDFQRLNNTALPSFQPASIFSADAPTIPPTVISTGKPGDIKYRDRRLLVLYFDTSTMPPQDQYRAFTAAR